MSISRVDLRAQRKINRRAAHGRVQAWRKADYSLASNLGFFVGVVFVGVCFFLCSFWFVGKASSRQFGEERALEQWFARWRKIYARNLPQFVRSERIEYDVRARTGIDIELIRSTTAGVLDARETDPYDSAENDFRKDSSWRVQATRKAAA